jgi:hypothetical protein
MASGFWQQVVADGLQVPTDRSLVEMTEELTRMLGDPDPDVRDGIAFPTIATWIDEGVYDDLLIGLGDGMSHGLVVGLGRVSDDTIFRRSFSALVLTECIDRSTNAGLASAEVVLRWGDQVMGWLSREKDLRDFVPGKGWAHAMAHGADALAALARSPYVGRLELTVVLDVIADRLLDPANTSWISGEDDRLALATMQVLQRNVLGLDVLEPWVVRVAEGARGSGNASENPFRVAGNVQAYLRSLHLQLALGAEHPTVRTDLLLVLITHLRRTNPAYFPRPRAH